MEYNLAKQISHRLLLLPIYKKGRKEDQGKPQACQPALGAREGFGAGHYMAHAGEPGDQAQPAWVYERQVQLDKPDLLIRQDDSLSG